MEVSLRPAWDKYQIVVGDVVVSTHATKEEALADLHAVGVRELMDLIYWQSRLWLYQFGRWWDDRSTFRRRNR